MTYEEIMGITPGSIVPNGFSITPNATYIGPGEPILDDKGNVAPGGHYVNKWDKILVLDIGYKRQLTLIQYSVGNNEVRQGYITNSLSKIEYSDLENNFWQNGSTKEIVYLSCSGDAVLGSLNPHERAIFLYKAGDRYSVVYSTDKGPYTQSGFVKYPGGISDQITQGRCLASGGSSINDIPAGGIVPGGRTYPANAVVKNDFLYIRDKDGKIIPGRQTSIGDEITVLDISYSKQLALIQYPAGNDIRQGYVTNSTKIINYLNPYQWVNGSTPETVYLDVECTREFGTIDPYESATLLYEKDGKHCVVYDAPGENGGMDMLNKNGFVHFPGNKPQATPSAGDLLYQSFPANVEKIPYGTSPLGHPLNVYKIGNGSNVLFANFAIHGFEDDWNHDGTALVNIANELIRKISATGDLHGWTVYVNNCANPDGTFNGITNDGPGRCTVTTGIDMNRCFPSGFRPLYNTRNYVGASPLGAPEAVALKNIVERIHSEHINGSNQMVVIDFHGWMGMTQGNHEIGKYFDAQFNGDVYYSMADGFFSTWAQESLSNTRAVLVEYPKNTRSIDECEHRDYAGRTYTAIMNLLADNSGNGVKTHISISGANGKIKSGTEWVNVREEPNTTSTILGQLHGNDEIKILAKVKPYGDSYYWYKIVFVKNGERLQAYVREDFVIVTGEIPKSDIPAGGGEPSKIDIAYQTVGQVNDLAASVHVRKGAGTGAGCDVVTSVNSGELLMILGEVQPGGETLPWYEIDINGQELYIRSDFVDIVPEEKMDKQGKVSSSEGWVHLRELPGTGSECTVITTLNNGDWMELIGKLQPKGGSLPWYRIKWQSTIGFIRSDFVSFDETEGSNNSNVNINYCRIAKAFGFDINKSLAEGVSTEIEVPNDINFKATATVLEEQLDEFNSIRVYNGSIINTPRSYNDLNVPYGKQTLSTLAQMLGNGLISFEVTVNNDITIIINAIENGARNSTSLRIKLQCISDSSNWTSLLNGIENLENSILKVIGVTAVVAVILACARGKKAEGAQVVKSAAAQALGGEGLEELEKFVEDNQAVESGESIAERLKALAPIMQEDLEEAQEEFKETCSKTVLGKLRKICVARDLTAVEDEVKKGIGLSGTHFNNPTIRNAISEFFKGCNSYVERSERSLTDEWIDNEFDKNAEYYRKKGISRDEVKVEMAKWRALIQRTKDGAKFLKNNFGEPSNEMGWNVENCAEIWAGRNAIMEGVKVENMVLKTVYFNNLSKVAPLCENCKVTFKEFIDSGRILE